jgi:hypothetical protein
VSRSMIWISLRLGFSMLIWVGWMPSLARTKFGLPFSQCQTTNHLAQMGSSNAAGPWLRRTSSLLCTARHLSRPFLYTAHAGAYSAPHTPRTVRGSPVRVNHFFCSIFFISVSVSFLFFCYRI